jgi:hypothetical protein
MMKKRLRNACSWALPSTNESTSVDFYQKLLIGKMHAQATIHSEIEPGRLAPAKPDEAHQRFWASGKPRTILVRLGEFSHLLLLRMSNHTDVAIEQLTGVISRACRPGLLGCVGRNGRGDRHTQSRHPRESGDPVLRSIPGGLGFAEWRSPIPRKACVYWVPAFAGMTAGEDAPHPTGARLLGLFIEKGGPRRVRNARIIAGGADR